MFALAGVLRVRNGAFWGNLGGDVLPGNTATADVAHSCLTEAPTGAGNVLLDAVTGDPFVVGPGGELFLAHGGLDGHAASTACVDAGDDAEAADAGIPWQSLTTRLDGLADVSPVDLGRHYPP